MLKSEAGEGESQLHPCQLGSPSKSFTSQSLPSFTCEMTGMKEDEGVDAAHRAAVGTRALAVAAWGRAHRGHEAGSGAGPGHCHGVDCMEPASRRSRPRSCAGACVAQLTQQVKVQPHPAVALLLLALRIHALKGGRHAGLPAAQPTPRPPCPLRAGPMPSAHPGQAAAIMAGGSQRTVHESSPTLLISGLRGILAHLGSGPHVLCLAGPQCPPSPPNQQAPRAPTA